MKNDTRISLHQLELHLFLGVGEAERSKTQRVLVDIDIAFQEPLRACITDQLKDTYCYDNLTQKMVAEIIPKSFRLLEHLTHEIYQLVKNSCSQPAAVTVKVTKKPLLSTALTLAGASFCYGDK